MKKAAILLEVTVVIGLFFWLRSVFRNSGINEWQESVFGAAPLTSTLLFFVLPLAFVMALRRNPGSCGLTAQQIGYHSRVALRGVAVIAPATILFPVIAVLGTEQNQWLGASILTIGFAVAGLFMTMNVRSLTSESESTTSANVILYYVALLLAGLILTASLHPISTLLARVILVLVFVGFLEEFFFRGYIQSRLNDCFGRPYEFAGVRIGAGLLIAALLFGLLHPLTSHDEITPWPWALWTAAMGLVFGFLREKTGAVIAPAIVHGVIMLPYVFFGG